MPEYFAYGSNMDPARMTKRVERLPKARRAFLRDHEFRFDKRGSDGTGKANIVPQQGSVVWGVVFSCTDKEMDALDAAEGAPSHYIRTRVEVVCDDGSACEAIAYVARPQRIAEGLSPSDAYRQHILVGARHFNLPDDYVLWLETA